MRKCQICDKTATHVDNGEVPFCSEHAVEQANDGFHMFPIDPS